ncbi:metal ABC transporter permease [Roseinatronobacter bogoriensis]|uniref:Metal ABC transporter permease n=1 Tax=Roseinatronobacter bogoriensis subsp. barguzinensis TaxID=441209 RepID=A0A2K8K7V6_9RHOB|nr:MULTISPECIES: metal ABC transporter permease [Rhodobaca]ATX65006.1 metal ABC transporter permease [Rhodobaca barguzinensis]MBB4208829.1 manganese/zinc/iron transport system permease protein [Rhodobaca bogoriensis DSM 18756]TDW37903.1 manganese/zinc/iron transport system permease protein [Rhodobaca barguzinensis]TDY69927.1 manganese/zinc/iron transport system permease protein [Rhodobaca bogoriensis DSM 18756]
MIASFFGSIPAMIVLTGILVGLSGALLGSFLVLRGNAMLTDAISHSIVFGIIVVWLMTGHMSGPVQVLGAALTGVLTVVLSELLARSRLVKMDAAIGLVFPALFAAGVLLISIHARDVHIDVQTVLLGEIGFVWLNTLVIGGVNVPVAVVTLGAVLVVNLAFVLVFWKELKLTTFDPGLAAALGFLPGVLHYAVLTLTSVTAVAAFDAVGAILFIAFVIVPPATAYLLTRRLWLMVVLAVGVSVAACVAGYLLAIWWNVSIAGMMASMTGVWFALALLFAPERGLIAQAFSWRSKRLDHDCRALVAHLFTHQDTPQMAEENTQRALVEHLRWPAPRARAAILRAHDRDLIERRAGLLTLRPKGTAEAEAIFGKSDWR